MKRCVGDLRFPGFEIGSHINELNLDDPSLDPIYKTCEQLNACLFVHPWDMLSGSRMSKYWLPWLVGMPMETSVAICSVLMGGVLLRHPKLKICFAHGGGAYPFIQGRIEHGYNVRPDLCATDCPVSPMGFQEKFYTDSLVHDQEALKLLVSKIGPSHVILGSDYPYPLGELDPPGKTIDSADIDETTKNRLRWTNGFDFLGLNPVDYKQSF